jgi:hypothetical protein
MSEPGYDEDDYYGLDYADFEEMELGSNRQEIAARVQPQLSCAICPPNRGENRNSGQKQRMAAGGPREKSRTKIRSRNRSQKAKGNGRES